MIRGAGLIGAFGATLLLGFILGTVWSSRVPQTTLMSLAPDGQHRVRLVKLVEQHSYWNFGLDIEDVSSQTTRRLYASSDEEKPIGTERIIWSPDSQRFVLVGRHFHVREGTPATDGDSLFILYDLASGRMKCNSLGSMDPPFEAGEVDWSETAPPANLPQSSQSH